MRKSAVQKPALRILTKSQFVFVNCTQFRNNLWQISWRLLLHTVFTPHLYKDPGCQPSPSNYASKGHPTSMMLSGKTVMCPLAALNSLPLVCLRKALHRNPLDGFPRTSTPPVWTIRAGDGVKTAHVRELFHCLHYLFRRNQSDRQRADLPCRDRNAGSCPQASHSAGGNHHRHRHHAVLSPLRSPDHWPVSTSPKPPSRQAASDRHDPELRGGILCFGARRDDRRLFRRTGGVQHSFPRIDRADEGIHAVVHARDPDRQHGP